MASGISDLCFMIDLYACVCVCVCVGAEIDCEDRSRNTALHIAARYGHELIITALIKHGADATKLVIKLKFVLPSDSLPPGIFDKWFVVPNVFQERCSRDVPSAPGSSQRLLRLLQEAAVLRCDCADRTLVARMTSLTC